jgi:hypothetical protein
LEPSLSHQGWLRCQRTICDRFHSGTISKQLIRIKPFLPFLLTFLVPRGIAYYRAIKTAIKTRPPPRPLPANTSRGLNVLFFSICLFFFMSFPSYWQSYQPNIFEITKSRLHTPTDVLFTRLALVRPLTPFDEALREKITTPMYALLSLVFILLNSPPAHPFYHPEAGRSTSASDPPPSSIAPSATPPTQHPTCSTTCPPTSSSST